MSIGGSHEVTGEDVGESGDCHNEFVLRARDAFAYNSCDFQLAI